MTKIPVRSVKDIVAEMERAKPSLPATEVLRYAKEKLNDPELNALLERSVWLTKNRPIDSEMEAVAMQLNQFADAYINENKDRLQKFGALDRLRLPMSYAHSIILGIKLGKISNIDDEKILTDIKINIKQFCKSE